MPRTSPPTANSSTVVEAVASVSRRNRVIGGRESRPKRNSGRSPTGLGHGGRRAAVRDTRPVAATTAPSDRPDRRRRPSCGRRRARRRATCGGRRAHVVPRGPPGGARRARPRGAVLVDEIRRLLDAGGKRVRPVLLRARRAGAARVPARSASRRPSSRAAAALELLHTFALIHDDVMDGHDHAPRRRSDARPSGGRAGGDRRGGYGLALAVLVGDLAAVLAERLLRTSGASGPRARDGARAVRPDAGRDGGRAVPRPLGGRGATTRPAWPR